jgi:hypothetical protein
LEDDRKLRFESCRAQTFLRKKGVAGESRQLIDVPAERDEAKRISLGAAIQTEVAYEVAIEHDPSERSR